MSDAQFVHDTVPAYTGFAASDHCESNRKRRDAVMGNQTCFIKTPNNPGYRLTAALDICVMKRDFLSADLVTVVPHRTTSDSNS